MDGIHDMGGMQGFGRVPRGPDAERSYHAPWQPRVHAMAMLGRLANVDAFRHAIERLDPVTYLTAGYYGRWLGALETLVREARPELAPTSVSARRDVDRPPRFERGARVRARDVHVDGHTRLPGYARGRSGVVVRQHGGWVFPDASARSGDDDPQHLYTVRFEAEELWGDTAEPGSAVHLDLFEPYLEAAS